jgi:hypothetical protein
MPVLSDDAHRVLILLRAIRCICNVLDRQGFLTVKESLIKSVLLEAVKQCGEEPK